MSVEQEQVSVESITVSVDEKTTTIYPSRVSPAYPDGVSTAELERRIACEIFLHQGKSRITARYPDYTDEITRQQLRDAALHWPNDEVVPFIEGKAYDFSFADEIIIERLGQ